MKSNDLDENLQVSKIYPVFNSYFNLLILKIALGVICKNVLLSIEDSIRGHLQKYVAMYWR